MAVVQWNKPKPFATPTVLSTMHGPDRWTVFISHHPLSCRVAICVCHQVRRAATVHRPTELVKARTGVASHRDRSAIAVGFNPRYSVNPQKRRVSDR